MNESVTLNVYLDNLSEEDREKFLALAEKAKEPRPKVWKPIKGETWYCFGACGGIGGSTWYNNDFCEQHYAFGNCFKTKEEAAFAVEKLKVITELKRFAEEHNSPIEWTDPYQKKYCIYYNYHDNEIKITDFVSSQYTDIVFTPYKIAAQAIETVGAERLKKYYFEIKEKEE